MKFDIKNRFRVDVGEPMTPMMSANKDEWRIYTANDSGSEIIVTPDKVPMLLEEIRKAQDPRAKEIIHSQYKREAMMPNIQAKILAFG